VTSRQETTTHCHTPFLAHVLIIHRVADYPACKRVFDTAATMRKTAGEHSYQILRERQDAKMIVHFSTWSSHDDATRFFPSPELEQIRRNAGVRAPNFNCLHRRESSVL